MFGNDIGGSHRLDAGFVTQSLQYIKLDQIASALHIGLSDQFMVARTVLRMAQWGEFAFAGLEPISDGLGEGVDSSHQFQVAGIGTRRAARAAEIGVLEKAAAECKVEP